MEILVDLVDGKLVKDDLTRNARGGTELLADRIIANVDPDLLQGVQIIFSRPGKLLDGYKKILYLHDLPGDPAIAQIADENFRNQFAWIVFVSHYQRTMFGKFYGFPMTFNMIVIKNAIQPIPDHRKPTDKLRLIYHTTPHRGLELLYPVFNKLNSAYPGLMELKVFSSFDMYGWGERDQPYEALFKRLEDHPDITYSKSVPNEQIRQELQQAHIFAFPSIWEETSCMALMEAMSANLFCAHSDLGALPETSFGMNHMYPFITDRNHHATALYWSLERAIKSIVANIDQFNDGPMESKKIIDETHNIDTFKYLWESYLSE